MSTPSNFNERLDSFSTKIGLGSAEWRSYPEQHATKIYSDKSQAEAILVTMMKALRLNEDVISTVDSRSGTGTRVIIYDIPKFTQALDAFEKTLSASVENMETSVTNARLEKSKVNSTKLSAEELAASVQFPSQETILDALERNSVINVRGIQEKGILQEVAKAFAGRRLNSMGIELEIHTVFSDLSDKFGISPETANNALETISQNFAQTLQELANVQRENRKFIDVFKEQMVGSIGEAERVLKNPANTFPFVFWKSQSQADKYGVLFRGSTVAERISTGENLEKQIQAFINEKNRTQNESFSTSSSSNAINTPPAKAMQKPLTDEEFKEAERLLIANHILYEHQSLAIRKEVMDSKFPIEIVLLDSIAINNSSGKCKLTTTVRRNDEEFTYQMYSTLSPDQVRALIEILKRE